MTYFPTVEERIQDLINEGKGYSGPAGNTSYGETRLVLVCPQHPAQGLYGVTMRTWTYEDSDSRYAGFSEFGFGHGKNSETYKARVIGPFGVVIGDPSRSGPRYQSNWGKLPGEGYLADGDVPHRLVEINCPLRTCSYVANFRVHETTFSLPGQEPAGRVHKQIHELLDKVASVEEGATLVVKLEGGNIERLRMIMP